MNTAHAGHISRVQSNLEINLKNQIDQVHKHIDERFDSMGYELQEILEYMQRGDAKKENDGL